MTLYSASCWGLCRCSPLLNDRLSDILQHLHAAVRTVSPSYKQVGEPNYRPRPTACDIMVSVKNAGRVYILRLAGRGSQRYVQTRPVPICYSDTRMLPNGIVLGSPRWMLTGGHAEDLGHPRQAATENIYKNYSSSKNENLKSITRQFHYENFSDSDIAGVLQPRSAE